MQTKPAVKKPLPAAAGGNVLNLNFDGLYTEMVGPGLARREYVYWDSAGKISAYFIEADKNLYDVKPVLARGRVPGQRRHRNPCPVGYDGRGCGGECDLFCRQW